MMIWIVMKNSKVDEVFDNFESAQNHQKNLTKKWSISEIIQKEVKSA